MRVVFVIQPEAPRPLVVGATEPMTKAVDDLWAIVNGWPGVVGVSDVSDSPCGPYLVVLAVQPELIMTAVPELVHGIPVVVQQSDRIVAQTGRLDRGLEALTSGRARVDVRVGAIPGAAPASSSWWRWAIPMALGAVLVGAVVYRRTKSYEQPELDKSIGEALDGSVAAMKAGDIRQAHELRRQAMQLAYQGYYRPAVSATMRAKHVDEASAEDAAQTALTMMLDPQTCGPTACKEADRVEDGRYGKHLVWTASNRGVSNVRKHYRHLGKYSGTSPSEDEPMEAPEPVASPHPIAAWGTFVEESADKPLLRRQQVQRLEMILRSARLTPQEEAAFKGRQLGYDRETIAEHLNVSGRMVDNYATSATKKVQALVDQDRAQREQLAELERLEAAKKAEAEARVARKVERILKRPVVVPTEHEFQEVMEREEARKLLEQVRAMEQAEKRAKFGKVFQEIREKAKRIASKEAS